MKIQQLENAKPAITPAKPVMIPVYVSPAIQPNRDSSMHRLCCVGVRKVFMMMGLTKCAKLATIRVKNAPMLLNPRLVILQICVPITMILNLALASINIMIMVFKCVWHAPTPVRHA